MENMGQQTAEIILKAIRVLEVESTAISEFSGRLQKGPVGALFLKAIQYFQEVLDRHGKIIVTGLGKSGKVGQKNCSDSL